MSEYDSYFEKESEPIYSQDFKESEHYREFLSYIADKKVALGVVKCKTWV
jgi:hypothetical protein